MIERGNPGAAARRKSGVSRWRKEGFGGRAVLLAPRQSA
jgi:hypothetical protein